MPERFYTAALSRDRNRNAFAVAFRHPVRLDQSGKAGRKVRRGLGTADEKAAALLVAQMSEILSTPELWDITARGRADAIYDPLIVEAFYDGIIPETIDHKGQRGELIPLPSSDEGYRSAVFVGTTGAGKTTLLRQLIGTRNDGFPSTSTSRTTVADTEIIVTDADTYRAAVTFLTRLEVRTLVDESLFWAFLAAAENMGIPEIKNRLLNHVSQRFRLGYILGTKTSEEIEDEIDDIVEAGIEDLPESDDDDYSLYDLEEVETDTPNDAVRTRLDEFIEAIQALGNRLDEQVRRQTLTEVAESGLLRYEEELEVAFREDDGAAELVDDILDEIASRFRQVDLGRFDVSRTGWPTRWYLETADRKTFFEALKVFSSNASPLHGKLLSPLVNGLRVAGRLCPVWMKPQKLVFYDVEGLGHSAETTTTVPPALTRLFDEAHSIVLVDNATQSMLSAPQALLKSVATSGRTSRLILCFTHFDQVVGDNLTTQSERRSHVFATVNNTLRQIATETTTSAETLRKQLREHCYFLTELHRSTQTRKKEVTIARRREIMRLVRDIEGARAKTPGELGVPTFDTTKLVLGVGEAIDEFLRTWRVRLGLLPRDPALDKARFAEHWTRIKAFTRRLDQGLEGYENLQPVGDLAELLKGAMYTFVHREATWQSDDLSEGEKQRSLDMLMELMSSEFVAMSTRRIVTERLSGWREAFYLSGPGSTFVRARSIDQVLTSAAPLPTFKASDSNNALLLEVLAILNRTLEHVRDLARNVDQSNKSYALAEPSAESI